MAQFQFKYPLPLVRWNGERHTFREFHDKIFNTLINPNSEFFVDNNIEYLPMGLRFHPESDELLVLAQRSDLFLHAFGIKGAGIYQVSDANIRGVTKLTFSSNYHEMMTKEFGFDQINTGTTVLAKAVMDLVGNIKKIELIPKSKKKDNEEKLYMAFKPSILTLCFFIAEAVRFRPVYYDSFGNKEEPSKSLSGWNLLLPRYWENVTKTSHQFHQCQAAILHYLPMARSKSFIQTLADIKLVGDLTMEELDLVNGTRLEGEENWGLALKRLRDCPKACDFAIKLKWMFLEVEELEEKIVGAFSSKIPVMSAADIKKKLQYNRESSQLEWVLRQLVKRGILDVNDNLYNVISRG